MKKRTPYIYFLTNVVLLPLILVIGDLRPLTIAIFWLVSLAYAIYYFKPLFKECGILFFLSPCILTYVYSIINYVTGSLYYSIDVLSGTSWYIDFFGINHYRLFFILTYQNLCNAIVVYIGSKYPLSYYRPPEVKSATLIVIPIIMFLFILFFAMQIFIIDFSFIGGSSLSSESGGTDTGLNSPIVMGIVFLISHKLNSYGVKKLLRLAIYAVMIIILAISSVGSKRELFFAIIGILIIEMVFHNSKIKFNLRNILVGTVAIALAVFYILTASITRGYGNFGVDSFSEAIDYVPMYAQSETFNVVVGNNFETPYHYASSVIACDYILEDKMPLLLGSSFLKVLFIPIPRSVFNYKPQSMVDAFTWAYDPEFRSMGGSFPVSVYSEFLANFHFLGIFFLIFFLYFFRSCLFLLLIKVSIITNLTYILFLFLLCFYILCEEVDSSH